VGVVLSIEHFVETGADGPDVCLGVVLAVAEDFGGHVEGGAEHGGGVVLSGQQFGESEVGDLDVVAVEEDVGELEVPVHDLGVDKGLEGVEDLPEVLQHLLLWQPSPLL
jgi:hypothetical protein